MLSVNKAKSFSYKQYELLVFTFWFMIQYENDYILLQCSICTLRFTYSEFRFIWFANTPSGRNVILFEDKYLCKGVIIN